MHFLSSNLFLHISYSLIHLQAHFNFFHKIFYTQTQHTHSYRFNRTYIYVFMILIVWILAQILFKKRREEKRRENQIHVISVFNPMCVCLFLLFLILVSFSSFSSRMSVILYECVYVSACVHFVCWCSCVSVYVRVYFTFGLLISIISFLSIS